MKINYEKSDMMCIGMEEEEINQFTRLFCRKKRRFSLQILRGAPSITKN